MHAHRLADLALGVRLGGFEELGGRLLGGINSDSGVVTFWSDVWLGVRFHVGRELT